MAINSKKSCCLRIGQRHNNQCAPLCTLSGDLISWVDELRYLGVIIMRSRAFKCSLHHAKKLFYRSANAVFGEIGRTASEEVVSWSLANVSCYSICLEACPLTKSDLLSMDLVINRFFMKLFKTSNINNVTYCQECFSNDMPRHLWRKRVTNFESKFTTFYLKV